MKLLVTGATGTVGGHVVRQLVSTRPEHGHDVVVLVRGAARARATGAVPEGVQVVQGDLTDPEDLRRALEGVDRAHLTMADDDGAAFAGAAAEADLQHVVLLSSFTAATDLPSGEANAITARHRAGEAALTGAGVPATFLRAAGFDSNVLLWAAGARPGGNGAVRTPHPDVALPVVDPADVAAAAVAVLLAQTPPTGAFSITGPERISVRQQARVLAEVLSRPLEVEAISEAEAARDVFPPGTPHSVTTSVLETVGPAAAVLEPSGDVRALTGRAPRTFAQWARDSAGALS
ncbi:NmrA family NAD(P)-binding protein [Quadrisphaera sp. DSM 44207]|uniref:NmrA family NAD(P)-binding protein n=1 Tax=Quadrisphaera sp. DSM 44207 TaxID=1881057 RepID=UPI00088B0A35|nr:NmrA family NAD(P)-binding protein [Quadrisphaera sp. DSM 44207]SDQ17185.1 Uncharacterized conserved protein YbjT, contains NAD(P)-binding and DUF2867 domains [Quadrisphaera sp. DSM 44207]